MLLLREYQKQSITLLREGFRTNKRQVLCLPTGAGKTVVFSEMVRLAAEKLTKTLVLTDRLELFNQTFKSISKTNVAVQLISADNKRFSSDAIVSVAMVETLARRIDKIKLYPQLIIIDEAHKGNFTKIIDAFPDAKVIGATATPVGKHFHKYYTNLVNNIDIPELVENGFLSPCKAYQMQDDISDLEVDNKGEYSDKSQFNHFNKRSLYDGVVSEYMAKTPLKKAVVFNVNIEHATEMNKAFNAAGIPSQLITSLTEKNERNRILKGFEQGLFSVINNCGILTTGWDCPSVEVVIMNRATKSLPLWLQCCGRGSRIYPNKTHFTVLDFGMNHSEHGLWQEARNWAIEPPKKKKNAIEREAPIKKCDRCEAINAARATNCAYCGFAFPIGENELKTGVMVELQPKVPDQLIGKNISQLSVEELYELQKSKKYKPTFVWRVVRNRGEEAINEFAKLAGYGKGWAYRQISDSENSHFNDYLLR